MLLPAFILICGLFHVFLRKMLFAFVIRRALMTKRTLVTWHHHPALFRKAALF